MKVVVQDHSAEVIAEKNRAILVALEKVGMKGEKHAVENVNKKVYDTPPSPSGYQRTGNLRLGIGHQLKPPASVEIGDRVKYARYVELGTHKMNARPFIMPAATEHIEEYKKIIIAELEKLL